MYLVFYIYDPSFNNYCIFICFPIYMFFSFSNDLLLLFWLRNEVCSVVPLWNIWQALCCKYLLSYVYMCSFLQWWFGFALLITKWSLQCVVIMDYTYYMTGVVLYLSTFLHMFFPPILICFCSFDTKWMKSAVFWHSELKLYIFLTCISSIPIYIYFFFKQRSTLPF